MIKPGQTECQDALLNGIANNTIPFLPLLTEMVFSISPGGFQLYYFDVFKITEIQKFLIESNSSNVSLVANIFKYTAPNLTMVGNFSITNFVQECQQDATLGRYYICIYNIGGENSIRLIRTNTTFPNRARIQVLVGAGSRLNISLEGLSKFNVYQLDAGTHASATLTKTNAAVSSIGCNLPINYYLIEGILPDGIVLQKNGLLTGIIDCIDCNKIIEKFIPSSSWYGRQAVTGDIYSWGRQWRFKARIELGDYSNIFDEQWFCIRVYKNWSVDHELLQAMDLDNKDIIIELPEDTNINQFCIPCSDDTIIENIITTSFNPLDNINTNEIINTIDTELCNACSNNIITVMDTIKLQPNLNIDQSNLVQWYVNNTDKSINARLFRRQLIESEIFNYLLMKHNIIDGVAPTSSISITFTETNLQLIMSIIRNEDDIDKQVLDIVTKNNVYLTFEGHIETGESMII
ncbi:MAG: hypothetical protein WC679_00910 [Bacteroidales bacterium]|jgi:hypothetical protein